MFGKRKAQRAAEAAAQHRVDLQQQLTELQGFLDAARMFDGVDQPPSGCTIALHAGERLLLTVGPLGLIEPRSSGGHWVGGSQGISVHVPGTKSMRYRVGASRGTYVRGEEVPTVIDTGEFMVTTQRAVFAGSKASREWVWAKLVGITHAEDASWTTIAVANRQKVSGVVYGDDVKDTVRFRIDLAVAIATNTRDELVQHLSESIAATQQELNAPAPVTPP